ncbi:hypothetical protein BDF19DRAFT_186014 [Syncephalis fuscata]|nr:hypothetical protein BDF19DRAFT_186014 [Syncephalis fuscata]
MRLVVSTIAICCLLATTTKAVNNVVVINNPVVRWALEHEEDTGKSPIYDSEDTDNEILPPMNEFLWDKVPFTSGLYGFKLANTGDYDVYGQVGLSISKWIFRDENTAIASAYYTNDYFGGATLKCSRDKKQNEHDERILRVRRLAL